MASCSLRWFYEDVKVDRATTSGRKRTITGADSDSDDEGGPGTNGSSGAPGGYEEEFDRNLWDKLRPPDGGVVNLPLQTVLPKGFEFLLMDTEQQMWFFVEQYLRLQTVMADRISVLQLVFQLSYCTPGRQYHVRRLNAAQTWALRKFSAVGITLLRSRKSQYFQVGVYGSNLLFGHDMEVGAVPFGKKERLQAQQQTALKRSDGSDGVGSRFEWERDELISSRLELMVETNFYVTVSHSTCLLARDRVCVFSVRIFLPLLEIVGWLVVQAFVSEDPEIAEIEKVHGTLSGLTLALSVDLCLNERRVGCSLLLVGRAALVYGP